MNFCITRERRNGDVAAQPGSAFCAALTAASISPAAQNGTRRMIAPVAGLVTSPQRATLGVRCLPSIQSGIFSTLTRALAGLFILSAFHFNVDWRGDEP